MASRLRSPLVLTAVGVAILAPACRRSPIPDAPRTGAPAVVPAVTATEMPLDVTAPGSGGTERLRAPVRWPRRAALRPRTS